MRNKVKRIIATATAAASVIVVASMAAAQENDKLYINGTLSENGSIEVVGEKKYLPLRAICEGLGFDVEWDDASRKIIISSIPVYITCSPDRDGYTFAKTAPMLLGEAPKLINDKTYVPMNFVEEILDGKLEEKTDGINVVYADVEEKNEISGTICEIIYDGENTEQEKPVQLVLGDKDDINSQTVLNLSDELSAKVKELGLEVGTKIVAEVGDLATASIPPQMVPVSISVAEAAEEAKDTVEISGTVCELVYDSDNNLVQIITGEKEDPNTQNAYNLSDELAETVKKLGIKEGSQIIGTADIAQTRSIPPQQALYTVELLQSVEISGTVCEVVYENDKPVCLVTGEKDNPTKQWVYILNDELSKKVTELGIKEGTKIKGTAKEMVTMSIPPQQPLLTVETDN